MVRRRAFGLSEIGLPLSPCWLAARFGEGGKGARIHAVDWQAYIDRQIAAVARVLNVICLKTFRKQLAVVSQELFGVGKIEHQPLT